VLKTYNNQFAVSGLKVESSDEELLVDACHIVTFTQTSDEEFYPSLQRLAEHRVRCGYE